jgi:hypothetical protein
MKSTCSICASISEKAYLNVVDQAVAYRSGPIPNDDAARPHEEP